MRERVCVCVCVCVCEAGERHKDSLCSKTSTHNTQHTDTQHATHNTQHTTRAHTHTIACPIATARRTYGSYDADAPSTRSSFSRLKDPMFSHLFLDTSEILAKRTSVPGRQMIFPVSNTQDYENNQLPPVDYLRVTIDGADYRTRTNINIFPYYGCAMPCYTGYDGMYARGFVCVRACVCVRVCVRVCACVCFGAM